MKATNTPYRGYSARFLALEGLLAALLWLLPTITHAQAIEAWVQRYNGPGNGNDYLRAMVVDTNGNVYVTGDTCVGPREIDYTYATIKYSSDGVPLWTNLYLPPGDSFAQPSALTVDVDGNVCVTGLMGDRGVGFSYCATIKYSDDGVPLWTNRYTQPGGGGKALAVDGGGNVFVAANFYNGTDYDFWTIKYSGAGALLWAKSYQGAGTSQDFANAMAVDAAGNVVVTGESENRYITIKYSNAGSALWTNWYSGPTNNIRAKAVALDAGGNVFVTGESVGNGFDYATVAYSSAGLPLWTNRYEGPTNADDHGTAIAVDTSGNVVVTGYDWWGNYVTIKYSSAGVPLWTNRTEGSFGRIPAIAVDTSGNGYLTGNSAGDYLTIAYSDSGAPLWTNRYNGPGNGDDIAHAVAVDASGNVFVAGSSAGLGTAFDFAVVKYVVPPAIGRQPLSCTNTLGTTAGFTVEAGGNAPLTYQWCRQGTNLVERGNISGVTTTNLLIANVQTSDAAGYSVVITNAYGSVTSSVAQLTVVVPPNPGRFSNLSYSPETGFSFIFRDGTLGRQFRIQTSSSLAAGSWVDWQSFTYNGPIGFMDVGAVGAERRFYRAISP